MISAPVLLIEARICMNLVKSAAYWTVQYSSLNAVVQTISLSQAILAEEWLTNDLFVERIQTGPSHMNMCTPLWCLLRRSVWPVKYYITRMKAFSGIPEYLVPTRSEPRMRQFNIFPKKGSSSNHLPAEDVFASHSCIAKIRIRFSFNWFARISPHTNRTSTHENRCNLLRESIHF